MLAAETVYDLVEEAISGRCQLFVGTPPFDLDDLVALYDTGIGDGAEVNGSTMEKAIIMVVVRSKRYADGSAIIEDIYKYLNDANKDGYEYKDGAYIIMIRASRPPSYEGLDARQRHIFTQQFNVMREVK